MVDNAFKHFLGQTKPIRFRRVKLAVATLRSRIRSKYNLLQYKYYIVLYKIGFLQRETRSEVVAEEHREVGVIPRIAGKYLAFSVVVTSFVQETIYTDTFKRKDKIVYLKDNSRKGLVYEGVPFNYNFRINEDNPFRTVQEFSPIVFRVLDVDNPFSYDEKDPVTTKDYTLDLSSVRNLCVRRYFDDYEGYDIEELDRLVLEYIENEFEDYMDNRFSLNKVLVKAN